MNLDDWRSRINNLDQETPKPTNPRGTPPPRDAPDRGPAGGSRAKGEGGVEDLGLTLGDEVREIVLPLGLAAPEGGGTALVEEFEDFVVEVVDPGSPTVQVHRGS